MSCCCAATESCVSTAPNTFVGVSYTSQNWSNQVDANPGIANFFDSDFFPNFTHDIKSFPRDDTSDYVAIAGGTHGCSLFSYNGGGLTAITRIIGSSSVSTGNNLFSGSDVFVTIDGTTTHINLGDEYGWRYGFDGFTGVYGLDFFSKNGKDFILMACGINGLDLYNITDNRMEILGGGDHFEGYLCKKVKYLNGTIYVGTAGHNRTTVPFNSTDSYYTNHQDSLDAQFCSAVSFANSGVRICRLLEIPPEEQGGDITYNFGNFQTVAFTGGGINDIVSARGSKEVYCSWSSHSPHMHVEHSHEKTSLVTGGGIFKITENDQGEFVSQTYTSIAAGQMVFDGQDLYWANIGFSTLGNSALVGKNQGLFGITAGNFLRTNSYLCTNYDAFRNGGADTECNFCQTSKGDREGYAANEAYQIRSLEFNSGYYGWDPESTIFKFFVKDREVVRACIYGDDGADSPGNIDLDTIKPRREEITEMFGFGPTGLYVCGGIMTISLWQCGFVSGGTFASSLATNIQPRDWGVDGPYVAYENINIPPALTTGRSTGTRFGPIVSVTCENIFGDMGIGHYGLWRTTGIQDRASHLMHNDAGFFDRNRGVLY